MSGTTRLTLNSVLRKEQDRGTIEVRRGRIYVRDVEQLGRRAR
jgi:hypothetical protein